jgi:hypothetical protein
MYFTAFMITRSDGVGGVPFASGAGSDLRPELSAPQITQHLDKNYGCKVGSSKPLAPTGEHPGAVGAGSAVEV